MNGAIYALRIKLSDFINDPLDHLVIDKINEINSVRTFKLQLWYDEGEIKAKDLKSFMKKYESLLHYKTTIRPNRIHDHAQYTWYNIIHKDDKDTTYPCRFQYIYESGWRTGGVLNGLEKFKETLKFIISPKPPKQDKPKRKQKRNDYDYEEQE
jgi:hypothetical protein|tara:strand:- start:83 stop:544 length:462 start_codon:yes stop_codon:yes gene_type:complete